MGINPPCLGMHLVLLQTSNAIKVSLVSYSYGRRSRDIYVCHRALWKLLPGDVVLADWGFDISESVGMLQIRLHIPAFVNGKDQRSVLEILKKLTV